MPSAQQVPLIFFVPGGCHTPWGFQFVRRELEKRGFDTASSPLVTVGCSDASVGLQDDVGHIRAELTGFVESGREVVVVAHSYGGMVASHAIHGLGIRHRRDTQAGGILMVLYLAAILIPIGTNLSMTAEYEEAPALMEEIENGLVALRDAEKTFYSDVEPSLAAKAIANLKPMSSRIFTDTSATDPWSDGGVAIGYVFTEADRVLPIAGQKAVASTFPADSFFATLESGHSPFLNMPGRLAEVIVEGVQHVRGGGGQLKGML